MCVTLSESVIIWKTVVNYAHIQAHSHKTVEFASLGPLQLGYAVFIASGKSSLCYFAFKTTCHFQNEFHNKLPYFVSGVGSKIMYSKSCVYPFHKIQFRMPNIPRF